MLQDDNNNCSTDNNNKLTTRRRILCGYKCMKLLAQHMKKQTVQRIRTESYKPELLYICISFAFSTTTRHSGITLFTNPTLLLPKVYPKNSPVPSSHFLQAGYYFLVPQRVFYEVGVDMGFGCT